MWYIFGGYITFVMWYITFHDIVQLLLLGIDMCFAIYRSMINVQLKILCVWFFSIYFYEHYVYFKDETMRKIDIFDKEVQKCQAKHIVNIQNLHT